LSALVTGSNSGSVRADRLLFGHFSMACPFTRTRVRTMAVIEQPEGSPLLDPVTLCAWSFGRELYRHRLFEPGGGFTLAQPAHREHTRPASKAGHWKPGTVMSVAGHVGNVALARQVMEIGWSTRDELAEAVPPFFTRWIGEQLAGWAGRKRGTGAAA
jgi:hypothetical protein